MLRTHRFSKSAGLAAVILTAAALLAPAVSAAATDTDLRAGIYPDANALALGAGILADVGAGGGWYFNPNVELAMGGRRDVVAMSGDFHYDFAENRSTSFWMGAGPAVLLTSRRGGDRETDVGLNVLTGLGARRGEVRPFAQLRGTLAGSGELALAGGVRF